MVIRKIKKIIQIELERILTINKYNFFRQIIIFVSLQLCIWYGGMEDFIPLSLVKRWNSLQIIVTLMYFLLIFVKIKKISKGLVTIIFFKMWLLFSSYINGREIDITNFTKIIGFVFVIEYFYKEMPKIIRALMLIFEIMIYYNLYTCLKNGPDLFGSYYGALGYDNGFPSYLLAGMIIAYLYYKVMRKKLRPILLLLVVHITLIVTWCATGMMAVFAVDILMIWKRLSRINISLIKGYCLLIVAEIGIVFLRFQNIFSYIIVDLLKKDLTFTGRTKDWDMALSIIPQKFFWGHGEMSQEIERSILGDVYCHNAILEQLFRGGIIYFLLFLAVIIIISKQIRSSKQNEIEMLNGMEIIIGGYWILSMTEVVLEGAMVVDMLALIYGVSRYYDRRLYRNSVKKYVILKNK